MKTAAGAILLAILLGSCARLMPTTQAAPEPQLFEGHYISSFEVSSFVPCGSANTPGYGQGYWLTPSPEFADLLRKSVSQVAGTFGPDDKIGPDWYVRFYGVLSPLADSFNGYGHLGAYAHAITVTQAIEVSYYLQTSDPCKR
jgi:hypothetical protein